MFSPEEPINKVIDKLKDDKNYYGDYGKQYLSNSNIRSLINSCPCFLKICINSCMLCLSY